MPNYEQLARNAARAAGIPENLFVSQIRAESGFNPNAQSPAGAQGIAQIMPATAAGWGVNPMDPKAALNAAARAMAKYVNSYGSYRDALVAYNAGPGRVGKPLYDETRNYINKIMGGQADVSKATPQSSAGVAGVAGPVKGTAAQKLLGLTPGADPRANRLAYIFKDRGRLGEIFKDRAEQSVGQSYEGSGVEQSAPQASGPDPAPGGKDWRWLQRIAQEKFGLKNDPGDSQTTGGGHTAGSRHYSGKAIDFGDARNSRAALNAWYAWALANKNKYGFTEVLDEGDHIHVAF